MGARGPLRKENHTGHHRPKTARGGLAVVAPLDGPAPVKIPAAPKGLSPAARKQWKIYWTSPVAKVAHEVDLPAIRRLFRKYDDYDRVSEILAKSGLAVKGSKGQIRVNPLTEHKSKLEAELSRLETELGLTPMARARLGLQLARGALTVEEINRMARRGGEVIDADSDDDAILEAELHDEWSPPE